VREDIGDNEQARFLMLCAAGRYAEAEAMLPFVYPDRVIARAGFYEDWGDAVSVDDPAVARTAYAEAEELFETAASWTEVSLSTNVDVDRVQAKRAHVPT